MQPSLRGGEGSASLNGRANDTSVSLSLLRDTRKDEPCDICGHNGEAEFLVTCTKCKMSCEHIYCMKMIPSKIPVDWVCESCLGGDKVTGKTVVPSVHQGAKFCWKKTVQAGKVKFIPSEEVKKLTAGAPDKSKITVARRTPVRSKPLTSLYSPPRKVNPTVDQANVSNARNKTTCLQPSGALMPCEEVNPTVDQANISNARNKTTCLQPSRASMSCEGRTNVKHKYSDYENRDLLDVLPNIHQYRPFLPALHVVWKGRIVFGDIVTTGECYGKFRAQPPCRVHRKAYEASRRLPPVLQVELLSEPLFEVNLFMDGSLQLHDIALYFSPSDPIERLKQKNSSVIDQLEIHRSIMRSYINGVELLIFASKHLHHDSQKIITKLIGDCLLLGVFRAIKTDNVESRERKVVISSAGCSQISDAIEAVDKKITKVIKDEADFLKCKAVVSSSGQLQICDGKSKFEAIDTKVEEKQTGNNSLISRHDAAINEQKLKSKLQEKKERDKSPPLVVKKIKEETENELPLKSFTYPPGFEKRLG